jgi:hypothetical protein
LEYSPLKQKSKFWCCGQASPTTITRLRIQEWQDKKTTAAAVYIDSLPPRFHLSTDDDDDDDDDDGCEMTSVVETTDKATLDTQEATGVDYGIDDAVVVAAAGEGAAADDHHCHCCCCCQRKTLLSFVSLLVC